MSQIPVTEADMHAYVDGLLSAPRRHEIAAYLTTRPDELQRLNAYRTQNNALRALFNPVLDEAVPRRLTASLAGWRRYLGPCAAGVIIALAGGAGGWMLHGMTQTGGVIAQLSSGNSAAPARVSVLAHQAAVAHAVYSPEVRHPVEIGADQEQALVTWLSKRTGAAMHPPKLGKLGYELVGGRLLPGESGPVAQFMYQENSGQRLTLYVSTDQAENSDTGFRFAQEGTINVFYWLDGKFGYALSGSIAKPELARIAGVVYEQLDKSR